ncbi:hypothetical protein [Saccharopolyspora phatthalungensis]|uniref:XRE family transcriptional regulator n=1 Tax=Saccharopolyspora phatthalungensis TaxID=664693 RepID=A0A840QE14_9PSEU|nr:hypothetical protein [Saccharopolyspora phatthalungensis]MBB5158070.1 hypothetical protein [Saccharopolyspora phatthalungensis]
MDERDVVGPDAAPQPPAGFWDRADVRAAISRQDFGWLLRAYRTSVNPPMPQLTLCTLMDIGQSHLSRLESGKKGTSLARMQAWLDLIHMPERLRWVRAPYVREASPATTNRRNLTTHEPPPDRGDDVDRRDALKLAGAALVSGPWNRISDALDHHRAPDEMTIQLIEDKTTGFFRQEETTTARTMHASLLEHGKVIARLLANTHRENDRRRLLSAAGETEALTGWLAYDLDRFTEAQDRYRSALKFADEAGDGPLTACVLNYVSYLFASQDAPDKAVQILADAGQFVRGSAATTQTWVAARQAEEAAKIGDRITAERAIERAVTAFDYARPHHERSWTAFFGANRLGSLTVSTYGRLSHPQTDALAQSLLREISPTETKVRALVVADLALSAARGSDVDRADELATAALPLAIRHEASLALDRLWELTETLPQSNGKGSAGALRQRVTNELLAANQS